MECKLLICIGYGYRVQQRAHYGALAACAVSVSVDRKSMRSMPWGRQRSVDRKSMRSVPWGRQLSVDRKSMRSVPWGRQLSVR